MSRGIRFVPLVVLIALLLGLVWRLATPADTSVRSRLRGHPVPAFSLPPALPGKPALSSVHFVGGGPRLLNIFASWCVPCITEVGILKQLQAQGVAVDGIAVRDKATDLTAFLARNGDPYERIGSDLQSRVQIDLGSSGVPESFIVDGRGIVRYQHVGPITAADMPTIMAKLEEAR